MRLDPESLLPIENHIAPKKHTPIIQHAFHHAAMNRSLLIQKLHLSVLTNHTQEKNMICGKDQRSIFCTRN